MIMDWIALKQKHMILLNNVILCLILVFYVLQAFSVYRTYKFVKII